MSSREEVLAAREAKKLAKLKAKNKGNANIVAKEETGFSTEISTGSSENTPKSKDEVDKAAIKIPTIEGDNNKEAIKAERAAKKAAKQAKQKGIAEGDIPSTATAIKSDSISKNEGDMTVRDVVETLRDIKNVAKEVKEVTEKVQALHLKEKKGGGESKPTKATGSTSKVEENTAEGTKSKAELRAERRAKQEAQRAAKQALQEKPKPKEKEVPEIDISKKEKSPKPKVEKSKAKIQSQQHTLNWFGHLYKEFDKDVLNKIPINSNLHPAIIKLGVQLATKVVSGSNARCIAVLDALKKMVRDYSLPAKTEFGRGLEAHLTSSLEFLWSMRQPTASQTNAVKFFRHHLNQLPNNVDEFDAKKTLQEEIDKYIREQIFMAGEAISIAVQKKISNGDVILTYGYSSLVCRILCEARAAGRRFRAVVCGAPRATAAMARALAAGGLPADTADITALNYVMRSVSKVLMGASALLGNGSVVGAAGTASVALAARALNVPVLVACETHKFAEHVHTDAIEFNELGDPDELLDTSNEDCPIKDWRSNPNLTPLNLTYDITPPALITAVVTELAILPCTSAPVVLRFKLSEYGI